jgi:hypothetical protein
MPSTGYKMTIAFWVIGIFVALFLLFRVGVSLASRWSVRPTDRHSKSPETRKGPANQQ